MLQYSILYEAQTLLESQKCKCFVEKCIIHNLPAQDEITKYINNTFRQRLCDLMENYMSCRLSGEQCLVDDDDDDDDDNDLIQIC